MLGGAKNMRPVKRDLCRDPESLQSEKRDPQELSSCNMAQWPR